MLKKLNLNKKLPKQFHTKAFLKKLEDKKFRPIKI